MASQNLTQILLPEKIAGLLDLATETRLHIYDYVFAPAKERCEENVGAWHYDHCCARDRGTGRPDCSYIEPGPSTCSPVSTAILLVNKQIYSEALPVMWESMEFLVRIPAISILSNIEETRRLFKIEEDTARFVRRIVLIGSTNRLTSNTRIASILETYCQLIETHRPRLQELRIHVDVSSSWRLSPLATNIRIHAQLLKPVLTVRRRSWFTLTFTV